MDGVLLRTVLSTYIHKDHVFRDTEKDLRKMAKGILAYAVEAIAYCCGCAADSCGLSPAIPSYPQLSPANRSTSAAHPQHISILYYYPLYLPMPPSQSTVRHHTVAIMGRPSP
jgi:hypothetical protein